MGVGDDDRGEGLERFTPLSSPHFDEVIALIQKPRGEVEREVRELFKMNTDTLTIKQWNLLQSRYVQSELIILVGLLNSNYEHKGSELRSLRMDVEATRKKKAYVLEVRQDYEKLQAEFSEKLDAVVGIETTNPDALLFDKGTADVFSALQDHIVGTGQVC